MEKAETEQLLREIIGGDESSLDKMQKFQELMMRYNAAIREVRTMDFWASLEHQMKYKQDSADRPEIAAELKSCAETIAATDARMLGIRRRIEALQKKNG